MAKAHGGIQAVNVANLSTAAATVCPFEGALDVDEPVPLLGPLRRKDTNVGHVQRHLNEVVHRDSQSEPGSLSSHRGCSRAYFILGPITAVPGEPNWVFVEWHEV